MGTMSLLVGGMGCRRCVREVTARIRDVPGVETVVADPESSVVRIVGSMSVSDVLTAFAGLAYRVELMVEPDAAADS